MFETVNRIFACLKLKENVKDKKHLKNETC